MTHPPRQIPSTVPACNQVLHQAAALVCQPHCHPVPRGPDKQRKGGCTHPAAAANAAKKPTKPVGVTLNHSDSHIHPTHTAVAVHCSKRKVGTHTHCTRDNACEGATATHTHTHLQGKTHCWYTNYPDKNTKEKKAAADTQQQRTMTDPRRTTITHSPQPGNSSPHQTAVSHTRANSLCN